MTSRGNKRKRKSVRGITKRFGKNVPKVDYAHKKLYNFTCIPKGMSLIIAVCKTFLKSVFINYCILILAV